MIKKLKIKFTLLATVSMIILMALLAAGMNLLNYSFTVNDADEILRLLSENSFSDKSGNPPDGDKEPPFKKLPPGMSPEVPYESRYFSVTISGESKIEYDTSRIISVSREDAEKYARDAISDSASRGTIGNFRYLKVTDVESYRIYFLDWGRKIDAFYRFLWISIAISLLGCIIVFLSFLMASEKIIRPISESYEKQKRFITDAGHELKTPLTVIGANTDILESDIGENECLDDIRQQTEKMKNLTESLVFLSSTEEAGTDIKKVDFPLSDTVSEEAAAFAAPARAAGKCIITKIEPGIPMNGSPVQIRRLLSILIDNALKYSDGENIVIELEKKKKIIFLSIENTVTEDIPENELSLLFDRFFRTDSSRNSETGGNGIGLSAALAITSAHGGKIKAECENKIFRIVVSF